MASAPLAKQSINSPVSIFSTAPFKLSALVPLKENHQESQLSPSQSELKRVKRPAIQFGLIMVARIHEA